MIRNDPVNDRAGKWVLGFLGAYGYMFINPITLHKLEMKSA